jgi:hypothetical protein
MFGQLKLQTSDAFVASDDTGTHNYGIVLIGSSYAVIYVNIGLILGAGFTDSASALSACQAHFTSLNAPIVLFLSRMEADRLYRSIENVAMCREVFLDLVVSLKSMTSHGIRIELERDSAHRLRTVLQGIDSVGSIFQKTENAIIAAGGKI